MNVREVVEIIRALNGSVKLRKTCDRLIEGKWDYPVTGVVITFMATVEVIHKSLALGGNLIITHEPTYFTNSDQTDWLKSDAVYLRKKALLEDNRISIWRYHDHMHAGKTDLIYAGLLKDLGWESYQNRHYPLPYRSSMPATFPAALVDFLNRLLKRALGVKVMEGYLKKNLPLPYCYCYSIPATSFTDLVGFLKERLGMKIIRVLGNQAMTCHRVGIFVGNESIRYRYEEMPARLMNDQQLDVMICGEINEWTLSAYVRDAAALGLNKAMVIVGHERSEEPGMKDLADRLRPRLKEIPVHFIDAGEPFVYL